MGRESLGGVYEGRKPVTGNYQQKGKWWPVWREMRLMENNLCCTVGRGHLISSETSSGD